MKLYTFDIAPNPRRVALFLQYKGIDLETQQVDLGKLEQFEDAFRAVNPRCTVPALVLDDGQVLADTNAICMYLDDRFPDKPLLGQSPLEKAQIAGWMHRIFYDGFVPVAEMLRNRGEAFKDRPLPGTTKMAQIPELVERGRTRLMAFFRDMDTHLSGSEFLLGNNLTQADIDLLATCDFAGWVKVSVPEDHVHLQRWLLRMREIF